jgi:hypothetical protein
MANPIKLTSKKLIVVLVCALLSLCFMSTVLAQSSGTVVTAQASTTQPQVASTLTVTIKISNIQNLFGIDTTLLWNTSVLTLTNSELNLGDSYSNGVLHGSKINTDSNNLQSGDIYVQETKVAGSYELVATSVGASTASFTGSGTIVTLTFNVVSAGVAGLSLSTDLSDKPLSSGSTANLIDHQDTASAVTAVVAGSSSSSPTSSSTSATSTSTTTSTPTVPEFPIFLLPLLALTAIPIILIAVKKTQMSQSCKSLG